MLTAVWRSVPRGTPLPQDIWRRRHRWIVALLVAHAPAILLYGLYRGAATERVVELAGAPLIAAAFAAIPDLGRAGRSVAAVLGLMLCSSAIVSLSGGAIEAHFHFFVMVPVMALYEAWLPFGFGVLYVLLEHGLAGTLDAHSVYDSPGAWAHPWERAGIHAGFFAAACVGSLVNWALHEKARTSEQALSERLAHQAGHDALTGLPNRTTLLREGAELLTEKRCGVAVLMLDLDRFKDVNDTLGHAYGDHLLVEIAGRLQAELTGGELLARLGGDEFAVLLDGAEEARATEVARRLRGALEGPMTLDGVDVDVDVSIGLATSSDLLSHSGSGEELMGQLLQQADVAMYTAKRDGGGVRTYDPEQDSNSRERLALLAGLRGALDRHELVVYFQPKVDARGGELLGVEALVRWQHPERGLLAPVTFVPAAENTGLIMPLTLEVLDITLAQIRQWVDGGQRFPVSINLSARCLTDTSLPDKVSRALDVHGVPAELLWLEITESSLMTDPGTALNILERIHRLGVTLSIDDFGTGYSSMSYLKRLPVDELKVDRSFVSNMLSDREDHTLVRSTIDLGHSLGLRICAEGVENASTLDELVGLGCDVVQGYHFGRPMPAEQLHEWLATAPAERVAA